MREIYYHAAGGILTRNGQVLILHKLTKDEWVLPKGHVEAGETPEAAALRETREETGYIHLRLLADLGTLRAEFTRDGERVTRDETYFLMELLDDERDETAVYDDAETDRLIFARHWLPPQLAAERLSFEPARTFMRRADEWLRTHG